MKREADNNRVRRAIEHINAAIANLNSIKWENRTPNEEKAIESTIKDLQLNRLVLQVLTEGGEQ